MLMSREAVSLPANILSRKRSLGGRKVRTGVISGMECKLRLVIASFLFLYPSTGFYPHAGIRTGLELTRLESNRDEWV